MSTLTGSEEQEVSGSDSDRYASCRESFDSETSPSSGKDSPAVNSSPSYPPMETKLVDEILYYADFSCEVAFIMPSLLPRYQKFRCMAGQLESFEEEVEPILRRRTLCQVALGAWKGVVLEANWISKASYPVRSLKGWLYMRYMRASDSLRNLYTLLVIVERSNREGINYQCQLIPLHK